VVYYLHGDHLGSTVLTTDGEGRRVGEVRYAPYGATRWAWGSPSTAYRYTGQRWEGGVGLYDYRARWYEPTLGRFVQPDTLVPEPGNPQDLNRYTYVRNNPLKYTDPTGHYLVFELDEGELHLGRPPDGSRPFRVAPGSTLFANPVEVAIANFLLSGDERYLETIPIEEEWGWALEPTLSYVITVIYGGAGDGGAWAGALADPALVFGLGMAGGKGLKEGGELLLEGGKRVANAVARGKGGIRTVMHHTVPREILEKYLPEEVADAVRGKKGAPNRWPIPEDVHKDIHRGPRGGMYNERWKEELQAISETGRKVTVEDVLRIRDQLIKEFGLEMYRR